MTIFVVMFVNIYVVMFVNIYVVANSVVAA